MLMRADAIASGGPACCRRQGKPVQAVTPARRKSSARPSHGERAGGG